MIIKKSQKSQFSATVLFRCSLCACAHHRETQELQLWIVFCIVDVESSVSWSWPHAHNEHRLGTEKFRWWIVTFVTFWLSLIRLLLYRLLFVTYLFPCHRKGKNQWKKCQRQKRGDMIVHLSSTIEKFNTSVFFSRPQKSFIQVCFFLDHRKVIYKSVY